MQFIKIITLIISLANLTQNIYCASMLEDCQEDICPVCIFNKSDTSNPVCKHKTCSDCIKEIIKKDQKEMKDFSSCPECRSIIKAFHPKYTIINSLFDDALTKSQLINLLKLDVDLPIKLKYEIYSTVNKDVKDCIALYLNLIKSVLNFQNDSFRSCIEFDTENIFKDINFTSNYMSGTVLHYAAKKNNLPIIIFLLQKYPDLDINKQNIYGYTPLIYACYQGKIKVANFLIDLEQIQLNIEDFNKKSALFHAIIGNQIKLVQKLIESGANYKTLDIHGNNALMVASENGSFDIIKYLLNFGFELSNRNLYGLTVFDILDNNNDNNSNEIKEYLIGYQNSKSQPKAKIKRLK